MSDDDLDRALERLCTYALLGRSFSALVSTLISIADDPRVVEHGLAAKLADECLEEVARASGATRTIIEKLRERTAATRAAPKMRERAEPATVSCCQCSGRGSFTEDMSGDTCRCARCDGTGSV